MSSTPLRTAAFLNQVGVNTHIAYTDGGYANINKVAADLSYLGITNVRDGISNGANGSAPLSSYIALAQSGIKFTFCISATVGMKTADLTAQLDLIQKVNAAVPGSVVAVEGANEINNFKFSYNGATGLQGALSLQKDLYSAVHSSPGLKGVAVDYFTGYAAGSIAAGPNPLTTAGLADFDTQHPYPNFGQAPAAWVNPVQALGNLPGGVGPAVYTETGYSSNGGTAGAVNADVQAKYTLDLLMDTAKDGVSRTYLYQLMDAYKTGSRQGNDGTGLFDQNNLSKSAATAIHNLTTILADTGTAAATFTPTALSYTLANMPTTGNSLDMAKSNGAHDIVVWNEPKIWDQATGTQVTAAASTVTLQLGASYANVEVFDPMNGTTPVQTLKNVSSVALSVTDHPLIVQVEPGLTPVAAAAPAAPAAVAQTVTAVVQPAAAPALAAAAAKVDAAFTVINGSAGQTITTKPSLSSLVNLGGGTEIVQSYGNDTISAGTGTSTIYANNNSHAVTANGGGAGSATRFIMSSGQVNLGAGTDFVSTYNGGLSINGGSGTAQIQLYSGGNTVAGGSGTLAVSAGGKGNNIFEVTNGTAGGTLNINGFNSSTDLLDLSGFGLSANKVIGGAVNSSAGLSLSLNDGTHINLAGVHSLQANSIHV